ncbi:MAG TPA: DinB family protein [Trueperaceae bacterium]
MAKPQAQDALPTDALRAALKSQYHAGLAMLRETIERCPDDVWYDTRPHNAAWQLAYHVLYFTHLYLMPNEAAFRPWDQHQADVQHPDGIPGPAQPGSPLPLVPEPYTPAQALAYCEHCDAMVDSAVDALDLHSPESGFPWYDMPKLEHQLVNLRHLAHHMAQLADRLRAANGTGIRWVDAGSKEKRGQAS